MIDTKIKHGLTEPQNYDLIGRHIIVHIYNIHIPYNKRVVCVLKLTTPISSPNINTMSICNNITDTPHQMHV